MNGPKLNILFELILQAKIFCHKLIRHDSNISELGRHMPEPKFSLGGSVSKNACVHLGTCL